MVKDEQYDSDASLYEDDGSPGPAKRPRHRKNPSELEISTTGSPEAWQPLAGATLDASVDGFWRHHINIAETRDDSDLKRLPLPLSRIKKVMRADPDVKLIAGEVPFCYSKACEIFIAELSMRAWLVAEANSRVTLTRADVANAIQRSDQFDFLVDIVPREDASLPMRPPKKPKKKESIDSTTPMPSYSMMDVGLPPMTGNDQVSMQEAMAAADELMAIAESQGGGTRMTDEAPWSPSSMSAIYMPVSSAM